MGIAWGYLERLARRPHRGTATAEEAAAAGEMAGWLSAMGYSVKVQPFRTPKDTLYWGPSVVLGGFAGAILIGLYAWPWLGILLCVLLLIPLVGEMLGANRVSLDLFLPKFRSQNVIARKATGATPVKRTLVVTAHYDTQRATYLFLPSLAPYIPWILNSIYLLLVLVPAALGIRWALPAAAWPVAVLRVLLGLAVAAVAFFVACVVRGRYINGANDNGTGAALALALAERFAGQPLPETEVAIVLTGAEEVGCRGMRHYMRSQQHDPKTTRFINLDNLGGGHMHYLQGEGMILVRKYSPGLIELAERISAERGHKVAPKANLEFPTDGLVPAAAGYEAITFIAFMENGKLPNYHWYTDTLQNVDRGLLEFAEGFLIEYMERLASVPAARGQSATAAAKM